MSWNPDLYLTYGEERTRPARDLAARIAVAEPRNIIDLGCGPGNSTAVLRTRWPHAQLVGLDSDPDMLAAAQRTDPEVRWVRDDVAAWAPNETFDIVFSNAALQWLPDHATLVPRLFQAVQPGGALAFQAPSHLHSPLHRHMLDLAGEPCWRDLMQAARVALVSHEPNFYYDALCPDVARLDLWVTEYCHVLGGPEDILTWIRGTGLRPYLKALPTEADRQRFETMLLERITESYPRRRDGRVLFPFHRLFLIAYRDKGASSHPS